MDFDEIINFIVNNYGWICLIMVAFVCLILEAIKVPLKKLTSKISNEKMRKLVNKVFIVLTFGISFLLYYVGNLVLPKYIKYDNLECLITGAFSNVLYALSEGLITTNKAKILTETIKDVTDGKSINPSEIHAVVESGDAQEKSSKEKEAKKSEKSAVDVFNDICK